MLQTAALRFWSKVDRRGPDECWPWQGWKTERGYGIFEFQKKRMRASRVAWELENKQEFPDGKFACHTCDNPPCCNPAHIWAGTHLENMRDCAAKGRKSRPTRCRNGHVYQQGDDRTGTGRGRKCAQCEQIRFARYTAIHGTFRDHFGHGKTCRRCGHHRVDDYRNGPSWSCRSCHDRKTAKRRKKHQLSQQF